MRLMRVGSARGMEEGPAAGFAAGCAPGRPLREGVRGEDLQQEGREEGVVEWPEEKAIALGAKGAYVRVGARYDAANRRELGSVYWRVGNVSRMVFESGPR